MNGNLIATYTTTGGSDKGDGVAGEDKIRSNRSVSSL